MDIDAPSTRSSSPPSVAEAAADALQQSALCGVAGRAESQSAYGAAGEFEAAVHVTDYSIRSCHKRVRAALTRTRQLLKKPRGEPFPFHDEIDTFEAALQATTAVTGAAHPDFDLRSDPRRVFAWCRDVQISCGHECREEGRQLEKEQLNATRLPANLALELLDLVARANRILEAPRE